MGDVICDDCGERPYCAPATQDYTEYEDHDEQPDATIWCECGTRTPIVFTDTTTVGARERPDYWGQSGSRFVCYECGEVPELHTSVSISRGKTHPTIRYQLLCRCEYLSVQFELRGVMPDKWKDDMDLTKWPEMRDQIQSVINENGPMQIDSIATCLQQPEAGVVCAVTYMQRDHELFVDDSDRYYTPNLVIDGPYKLLDDTTVERREQTAPSDPDETGPGSGKESGWFSKLLGVF